MLSFIFGYYYRKLLDANLRCLGIPKYKRQATASKRVKHTTKILGTREWENSGVMMLTVTHIPDLSNGGVIVSTFLCTYKFQI